MALVNRYRTNADDAAYQFLSREVPMLQQREIANRLMEFLGYNLERGRLDETEHPFTVGMYKDVRICTHYHLNNFMSSVYTVLHEAGHALYEQNIPERLWWLPAGTSCSTGIHESQSRFVENIMGRSIVFWQHFLPIVKSITGNTFSDVEVDEMARAVNRVTPSKIRIEADEVTYSLHVILRFELENDLIHDDIDMDELPAVWNEKMDHYLGVTVEHDSEGVLQDTHWASGLFGYFPDYALGNVYDGMFLECLEADEPQWRESVASGNGEIVTSWLASNIHEKANLHDPLSLVREVTGKDITALPFLQYLGSKMDSIHGR